MITMYIALMSVRGEPDGEAQTPAFAFECTRRSSLDLLTIRASRLEIADRREMIYLPPAYLSFPQSPYQGPYPASSSLAGPHQGKAPPLIVGN